MKFDTDILSGKKPAGTTKVVKVVKVDDKRRTPVSAEKSRGKSAVPAR